MAGPVGCALAGSTEGVWESLFKVLSQDAGFAYILVDSIIVRAHQHSANDITRIEGWLNGLRAGHVLADKGYDGQRAMDAIAATGAKPVVPRRLDFEHPSSPLQPRKDGAGNRCCNKGIEQGCNRCGQSDV